MPRLAELATGTPVDQLVQELNNTNAERIDIAKRIGAEIMKSAEVLGVGYTFDKSTFFAAATGEISPPEEVLGTLQRQLGLLDHGKKGAPVVLTDSIGLLAVGRLDYFTEESTLFPRYKFNIDHSNDCQFSWSADVALADAEIRELNTNRLVTDSMFRLIKYPGRRPMQFARGTIHYGQQDMHVSQQGQVALHLGANRIAEAIADTSTDDTKAIIGYFADK